MDNNCGKTILMEDVLGSAQIVKKDRPMRSRAPFLGAEGPNAGLTVMPKDLSAQYRNMNRRHLTAEQITRKITSAEVKTVAMPKKTEERETITKTVFLINMTKLKGA
ncbi:hypothetical protein KIN20_025666 [Parelaphostrongylus tenuis]|uniref:Uncharacterized protein n=1 Tax=Parelaphostrongylus tenuis TaxID=148309 RepID=A0AAD5QX37_PARTN|nr:hypothetical protein KIN20_025666 [Parelaphostrongylus tenuis]